MDILTGGGGKQARMAKRAARRESAGKAYNNTFEAGLKNQGYRIDRNTTPAKGLRQYWVTNNKTGQTASITRSDNPAPPVRMKVVKSNPGQNTASGNVGTRTFKAGWAK